MKIIVLSVIPIFLIGCGAKDPVPREPIIITKKCETKLPTKPIMSDESGDNVQWLKATLENSTKKDSYIYDLEAAIEKCL